MDWLDKKLNDINKALSEVENSNLTNETKTTILNILKEEVKSLELMKTKIDADSDFVKNGFHK